MHTRRATCRGGENVEKVQALNEIRRRVQTATEKNLLFKQIDENFGDGEALFTFAFDQTDCPTSSEAYEASLPLSSPLDSHEEVPQARGIGF